MSVVEKAAVLYQMEALSGRKRQALVEMGIPRSTYSTEVILEPPVLVSSIVAVEVTSVLTE